MAESQKNASVMLKDDNLLLDLDIGKDFLSSWKSVSMAEEAAVDFGFSPVSKGKKKKKKFSFDKVDMDFNLDEDFGKISSFNMDIKDLDISSPRQIGSKSKEKSKVESSGGNGKGKTEQFNFTFDFDGLGSFNFESSLEKNNPIVLAKTETSECSPDDSSCQGKEDVSNLHAAAHTTTLEKGFQSPLVPGTATQFDLDHQVGTAGTEPARNHCYSILEIIDSDTSKYSTSNKEDTCDSTKASSVPTVATTMQPKISQSEKLKSPDSFIEACAGNISIPEISSNSISNSEPRVQNFTCPLEVDSTDNGLTASMGDQEAFMPSMSKSVGDQYPTSDYSCQLQCVTREEKNNQNIQSGTEMCVKGSMEMSEVSQFNSHVENSCITSVISGRLSDIPTSSGNRKDVSLIHILPLVSRQVENLTCEDRRKSLDTCSTASLESVKAKSHAQKLPSTRTSVSLLNNQKVSFTHPDVVDGGTREQSNISGNKSLSCLSLENPMILRPELTRKQNIESFKDLKIFGVEHSADGVKHKKKLINLSARKNEEVGKTRLSMGQGKGTMEGLRTFSQRFDSNEKMSHNTTNLSNVSFPTLKKVPAKEEKILGVERGQMSSDLCSLKNLSLNHGSSKSPSLSGVHSSTDFGQKSALSKKLPADISNRGDLQNKTLVTLPLKRKALEESNADLTVLNPSKRFSESPDGRRDSEEVSKKVFDKKVSTFDTPIGCEDHFGGLVISFSAESYTNIKQAEAYTKELDKICSMLRNKKDEAKEVLVRSVVNGNKLLLLNHTLLKQKLSLRL